jgi:hypothetical protein
LRWVAGTRYPALFRANHAESSSFADDLCVEVEPVLDSNKRKKRPESLIQQVPSTFGIILLKELNYTQVGGWPASTCEHGTHAWSKNRSGRACFGRNGSEDIANVMIDNVNVLSSKTRSTTRKTPLSFPISRKNVIEMLFGRQTARVRVKPARYVFASRILGTALTLSSTS